MKITDFEALDEAPSSIEARTVMIRLIDGILFRFYHATEELTDSDYTFRPAEDCMRMNELLFHIEKLTYWVLNSFTQKPIPLDFPMSTFSEMRLSILKTLKNIKSELSSISDSDLSAITIRDYPFWNMINGPLADILTHVGQINTYRRLNGNPAQSKKSPFTGK